MTQIIEILEYKPEYLEATRKFLTQLTTRPKIGRASCRERV